MRFTVPLAGLALLATLAAHAAPRGAARSSASARIGAVDPKDGPDLDLSAAIEDGEVRLQVITNLAFLDARCDLPRARPEALEGAEREYAREALFALFAAENTVSIDGVEVAPLDGGFDVDPGDPSLVPHFPRCGARALYKTRLTLVYPCPSAPRRVALVWRVFPPVPAPDGRGADTAADVVCRLTGAGRSELVRFSAREPEHTWHRPAEGETLLDPVPPLDAPSRAPFPFALAASAVVAGALTLRGPRGLRRWMGPLAVVLTTFATLRATEGGRARLPSAEEARHIFEPLHSNIYRAFDYTRDEDVYDALAASVDGALLARLYDEVYRSLVMQEEGGAVSRVERVRYVDARVTQLGVDDSGGRPGFVVDARWQVDGAVYHWGHAHTRTNEYRAEYTVLATAGGWRIHASRMLEQRRVDAAPLPE